jgi:L-aspartate oxidase
MAGQANGKGFDVIVIGSGIAGLVAALTAAPRARTALVTKGALSDGCSRWAQGGIAAAVGPADSPERHFEDTLAAGRGLSDPAAVRVLVEEGPARVRQLIDWGVGFDTQDGELLLGREAAHSEPRILHAHGDGTGLEIETALIRRLRATSVTVFEHCRVSALLVEGGARCAGVEVSDAKGSCRTLSANAVILASGGGGRLWRHTTNPESATGDGVALAFDAGADVASMEFVQFHPTALAVSGAPRFLISEAVRGEGAHLVDATGERFLFNADPRGELAGRDVVSRAIWDHLQRTGEDAVFLDCAPIAHNVPVRFPTIYRTCLDHGLDMTRDLIPVRPAAHYLIGGVRTDIGGATSLPGLYACGEVAYSGVHGANRLASNSLLESVVFAHRAVDRALGDHAEEPVPALAPERHQRPVASAQHLAPSMRRLRDVMWEGAGLVRDATGLRSAANACDEILDACAGDESVEAIGARAAARTASLICASALIREESRGCHIRSDYEETLETWHGLVVMHQERGAQLDRDA